MKASFFEYNVAMSGIFTARASLNVVGHNMANAAIPGYSRQQAIQRASRPLSLYDGKGMYGTGSEVIGIKQIRDKYLDNKYWQHQNVFGEYRAKNTNLELIENVFNDLPDSGVLSCFRDYFDGLSDLSTNVPDQTYRANVINAAETLTQMVRNSAEALQKNQRDLNAQVENTVTMINTFAVQIADINEQIKDYERDGSMANDLRDQRARLVDSLSELVNIEAEEEDFSTDSIPYDLRYTVMINGQVLVQEDRVSPLMVVARGTEGKTVSGRPIPKKENRNEMDVPGLYDIYFANSGTEFDIYSITLKGTLKGLIDVRDGNNGNLTEPIEAVNITGRPGTYVNAENLTGDGDALAIMNLDGGDFDIIDALLANPGSAAAPMSMAALQSKLAALNAKPNATISEYKNLAKEYRDTLAMADYSVKDMLELSKAVLPDADYDAIVNTLNAGGYSENLSGAMGVLDKIMNSTAMSAAEMRTALGGITSASGFVVQMGTVKAGINTAVSAVPAAGRNVIVETEGAPPSSKDLYTTTLYKGIPFYMNKLNTLVRTFARSMNEGLDFKFDNIPKDTNGNLVGHMYGYDYNNENTLSLLFTSANGINTGANPSDMGGLSMWRCTYEVGGVEHTETLTSNNDVGPDLPPGATLTSDPERVYVWETTYTLGGKVVRNIEIADENGPVDSIPDNAEDEKMNIISETTVDYSSLNALNFVVNPELLATGGSFKLACSSDPTRGESLNDVILGFSKIGEYNSLFREGKLLDFIIGTNNHLAIDRNQSGKFEENYEEIKMMTDNQRLSVSGVDTNEEIANMIKYNQQFTACAKLVNVINQIYDTLINRLGV